MCGVVGIIGKSEAAPIIYDALTILQHRGQDASGIATCKKEKFFNKVTGRVYVSEAEAKVRFEEQIGFS